MENNCIQMAASAGHVAYTIGPISKSIIDCVQLYFTNGFTNIVLYRVNCLWLVGVTLIFDGTLQIIVQLCQIAAPRWPNDISSAADNAIFKNRVQAIVCSFSCAAGPLSSVVQAYTQPYSFGRRIKLIFCQIRLALVDSKTLDGLPYIWINYSGLLPLNFV